MSALSAISEVSDRWAAVPLATLSTLACPVHDGVMAKHVLVDYTTTLIYLYILAVLAVILVQVLLYY